MKMIKNLKTKRDADQLLQEMSLTVRETRAMARQIRDLLERRSERSPSRRDQSQSVELIRELRHLVESIRDSQPPRQTPSAASRSETDDADERLFASYVASVDSAAVREIRDEIRKHSDLVRKAARRDITVFVGNTGSGKSTTLNILADNNLITGEFGDIELAPQARGLRMGAGSDSITAYPQDIESPTLGMLYDMPGFEDTGGAVRDLINAGLMKAILEKAATVKVVLVVSRSEVEARAKGLRSAMKHIRMFPSTVLDSSLSVVLTKVPLITADRGEINPRWFQQYVPSDDSIASRLLTLLDFHKVRVMPEAKDMGSLARLQREYKEYLEHHLQEMRGSRLDSLRMGMTLNTESGLALENYFSLIFLEQIKQMRDTEWMRSSSAALQTRRNEYKRQLLDHIDRHEGIVVLRPLGEGLFESVRSNIMESEDGEFDQIFAIAISRLVAIEQERIAEQARSAVAKAAEEERRAREAEQEAVRQKDLARAAEAKAKSEAAKAVQQANAKEAEAAQARAATARAQAETQSVRAMMQQRRHHHHHHHGCH
jgi:energy-coupling factor transporter ATP-binding protein EcfA2